MSGPRRPGRGPGRGSDVRALPGLVRFQLVRLCRWPGARLAVGALTLAATVAGAARATNRMAAGDVAGLMAAVFFLALAGLMRLDIGIDRSRGYSEFLTPCFLSPGWLYLSRLLAALAAVLGFGILAALLLAGAMGSIGLGAWHAALWTAIAVMLIPAVVLTELGMATRLPLMAVLTLLMVALAVPGAATVSARGLDALGLMGLTAGRFADLWPATKSALLLAGAGGTLLYPAVRWTVLGRAPPGRRR